MFQSGGESLKTSIPIKESRPMMRRSLRNPEAFRPLTKVEFDAIALPQILEAFTIHGAFGERSTPSPHPNTLENDRGGPVRMGSADRACPAMRG